MVINAILVRRAITAVAVTAAPSAPLLADDIAWLYSTGGEAVTQAAYAPCDCPPNPCPPNPCPQQDLGTVIGSPSDMAPQPTPVDVGPQVQDQTAPAPQQTPQTQDAIVESGASNSPQSSYSPSSSSYGGATFASTGVSASVAAPGYIGYAPIGTRVRMRYDNLQDANEPTRGEFLYPTVGNFGGPGPAIGGVNEVDYQEISIYTELQICDSWSVFLDVPIRFVSDGGAGVLGNGTGTTDGIGDIRSGVRMALIDDCCEHLTAQIQIWSPTGDAGDALGVGHTSIDVGFMYDNRIGDYTTLYAELNDWQSIDAVTTNGTAPDNVDLNGNILRYGVGLGVDLLDLGDRCSTCRFTALAEVVGWTVLDGYLIAINGSTGNQAIDASGDTIINGKYGLRWTGDNSSVYAGYGHNWSKDRWYSDIFRIEYMWTY